MKTIINKLLYLFILTLLIEAGLWLIVIFSPSIDMMLQNRYAQPTVLPSPTLGTIPNPKHGDMDARGFRNAGNIQQANIVVLGDSMVYGVVAKREYAWPQQLERILNDTVYNMGAPATGPGNYFYYLGEAIHLRPKLVITSFYLGNDLWGGFSACYRLKIPDLECNKLDPVLAARSDIFYEKLVQETETATAFIEYKTNQDTNSKQPREQSFSLSKAVSLLKTHSKTWGLIRAIKSNLSSQKPSQLSDLKVNKFNPIHWQQIEEAAVTDTGLIPLYYSENRTALHPGYRIQALHQPVTTDEAILMEGLRHSLEILRQIDIKAKMLGVRHLVVIQPTKELIFYDEAKRQGINNIALEELKDAELAIIEKTEEFFTDNDIDHLNLLEGMKQAVQEGKQIYPYSAQSHPNALGYGTIATIVADRISQHLHTR